MAVHVALDVPHGGGARVVADAADGDVQVQAVPVAVAATAIAASVGDVRIHSVIAAGVARQVVGAAGIGEERYKEHPQERIVDV
jgi:hypothetical protein